jgi:hypothetical protein
MNAVWDCVPQAQTIFFGPYAAFMAGQYVKYVKPNIAIAIREQKHHPITMCP